MLVTVNTDASFSHGHKVGGYAFYIICDTGKMLYSGRIKKAEDPMDCEMKAIANALFMLEKSDLGKKGISKIIINSDCLWCFQHIAKKSSKPVGKYIFKRLESLYNSSPYKTSRSLSRFFELRHVKAHVDIKDARSWVNDWCDRQAKIQMRKQVKELSKKVAK